MRSWLYNSIINNEMFKDIRYWKAREAGKGRKLIPWWSSEEDEMREEARVSGGSNATDHGWHGVPHQHRPSHLQPLHQCHQSLRQRRKRRPRRQQASISISNANIRVCAAAVTGACEVPVEEQEAVAPGEVRQKEVPRRLVDAITMRQHHRRLPLADQPYVSNQICHLPIKYISWNIWCYY